MKGYDPLKLFATVCMVILVFASLATAAQFQADVVESREVETRKGHIWYKDGIYRLQMEHPGVFEAAPGQWGSRRLPVRMSA